MGFLVSLFDITFTGNWRPTDWPAVINGVLAFAMALGQYTGTPPAEAFTCVMGPVEFRASGSIDYPGFAYNGVVYLRPGEAAPELVAHELGHLLSDRPPKKNRPYYYLSGIHIDGLRLHPGNNPVEVWADLVTNWVFSTFAPTEAGRAQYDLTGRHIARMVEACVFIPKGGMR